MMKKDEDRPAIAEDMLKDAYEGLSEFAGNMDYGLAKMVLDSVQEYKLPPDDEYRFERLRDMLSQLDWDGIKEIIQETH